MKRLPFGIIAVVSFASLHAAVAFFGTHSGEEIGDRAGGPPESRLMAIQGEYQPIHVRSAFVSADSALGLRDWCRDLVSEKGLDGLTLVLILRDAQFLQRIDYFFKEAVTGLSESEVMAAAATIDPPSAAKAAQRSTLLGLTERFPSKALDLALESGDKELALLVLSRWSERDASGALDAVAAQFDGRMLVSFQAGIINRWIATDPNEAFKWLRMQDPSAKICLQLFGRIRNESDLDSLLVDDGDAEWISHPQVLDDMLSAILGNESSLKWFASQSSGALRARFLEYAVAASGFLDVAERLAGDTQGMGPMLGDLARFGWGHLPHRGDGMDLTARARPRTSDRA